MMTMQTVTNETGRGQGTTFKRITYPEDTTQTGQNQLGPRWQTSRLPLDLEPQYTLTVTHQHLNDTPTGTMTVPRPTRKGHKVGGGPIPGNPHPFPKIAGNSSHSLAYEITHSYKN